MRVAGEAGGGGGVRGILGGAGGRLGQGGGYYDRTFAARPEALRVGVAYAGQRVERLTLLDHDIPLHGVLTETGYTAFS